MGLPKISVITPSFNQGKYIKATIESVLSQNYPNLEFIVVDGGSTDETVNILKSYGNKLKWVSKKDRGQSHAINKGLKMASGELLAYLNSDDVYLPGTLKYVGEYYASHRSDWITGDCDLIDENGAVILKTNWLVGTYKKFLSIIYSPLTLKIVDNMIPQPSTFWSRRAYEKIGGFNESYHYVMDYDYWIRLSKFYKPVFLPRVLSGFRAQSESKSETSRDKLMAEGDIMLKANGARSWQLFLHRAHSDLIRFAYNLLKR